jgi:hypothetical protein
MMSLYVSPYFSSLLGFISSLPQLAWDKILCCCCCCRRRLVDDVCFAFWIGSIDFRGYDKSFNPI